MVVAEPDPGIRTDYAIPAATPASGTT